MRLILELEGIAGCRVAVAGPTVVGTDPEAEVVLNASGVAPLHVRLAPQRRRWFAEPLPGAPAVWWNGTRLQGPVVLADGDRLVVGEARILVRCPASRLRLPLPKRSALACALVLLFSVLALVAGLARASGADRVGGRRLVPGEQDQPGAAAERLPRCDPQACTESVTRLRAQARRLKDEREVAPRNAFDGWLALRRARLFAAAPGVDAAAAIGLDDEEEEASVALAERCSALRFAIHRSLELGEPRRAHVALERLAASFPGPEHPCHQEVGRLRKEIEAGRGGR